MAKKKAKKAPAKKPAAKKSPAKAKKVTKSAKKTVAKAAKKPVKAAKKSAKASVPPKKPAKATVAPKTSKTPAKNWQNYLTPLDDRLIVEIQSTEKRTPGGLYIPDTADVSGHYHGKVLGVGRGHQNKKGKVRPMDVRAGDTILFTEHAGTKINLEGKDYRILRESEVLGIVEKD